MNHFTFTCIALSFTAGVIAQPVLQGSDINPSIGESFVVHNAGAISPGTAGDNVTWDLSGMTSSATSTTVYSAANAGFPGSNITVSYDGSTMAYLNIGAAGTTYYGLNAGGTVITYQDPLEQMALPLSNNATHTDYFHATFTNGVPFERFGNGDMEVDGYGTLITPEGTFSNVLRVHYIQDYKDSNEFVELIYHVEVYAWYKAGIHNELASISSITYPGGTSASAGYLETGGLGLTENEQQTIVCWPNPANDNLSVSLENQFPAALAITDLNGRTFTPEYQLAGNEAKLDVSGLNAGVYFLQVTYDSGLVQQGKFIVN